MNTRCAVGLGILVAVVQSAQARNIVVDGGFENPEVTNAQGWEGYFNGDVMGSWSVGGAGVVLVEDFGSPAASEGDQCVELNFFQGGSIQQVLSTTGNQWYRLSFDMAGQTNAGPDLKTLHIYWGDTYLGQFAWSASASGGAWETHTVDVLAPSDSISLLIVGEVQVDGGPYIDNVQVNPVPGAGTAGVLGVGLAWMLRRRR